MTFYNLPNWPRITLLILSIISFAPQLFILARKQDSKAVSITYVLLNLVAATEQFAVAYFFAVYPSDNNKCMVCPVFKGTFSHEPLQSGDLIDLSHFLGAFVVWLVFFGTCLFYRPVNDEDRSSRLVNRYFLFYLFFFVTSLGLLLLHTAFGFGPWNDRALTPFLIYFLFLHLTLIVPVIPFIQVTAVIAQAVQDRRLRTSKGPYIQAGLAAQAVAFVLVTSSWPTRLLYDYQFWTPLSWYFLVGWIPICNGIFAAGQAFLLFSMRGLSGSDQLDPGERRPLLSSHGRDIET